MKRWAKISVEVVIPVSVHEDGDRLDDLVHNVWQAGDPGDVYDATVVVGDVTFVDSDDRP